MPQDFSDESVVKRECAKIISEPTKSNFINMGELLKRDKIQMHFCHRYESNIEENNYFNEGGGVNVVVGSVLTEADWASRWSDATYQIDASITDS